MIQNQFFGAVLAALCGMAIACVGHANTPNLAPGFSSLPQGSSVVLVGPDLAMYNTKVYSAEYRADWSSIARKLVRASLLTKTAAMGLNLRQLTATQQNEMDELSALHVVVGKAIVAHQYGPSALPTKAGQLDWSFGDAVARLREISSADYALFVSVREFYMGAGQGAAAVGVLVLVGGPVVIDRELGYASLVDLRNGRVLWFRHLNRAGRDLRNEAAASETVDRLLTHFPSSR